MDARRSGRVFLAWALLWAVPAAAGTADARLRLRQARPAPAAGIGVASAGAASETIDVLARVTPGTTKEALAASHPSAFFRTQAGNVITVRLPVESSAALAADPRVERLELTRKLKPLMNIVKSNSTLSSQFLGVLQNPGDVSGITGTGVVVGIVDTGIDWNHADFKNGATSRILYLWDQTDTLGPGPSGYSPPNGTPAGTEWTQAQITAGSPRETDSSGHGTHVSGIAVGDGSSSNNVAEPAGTYTGIAPNADIIFVKTDFTDAGVVDAMDYIVTRARQAGKKAVINLSLGGQGGGHDGRSAFEQAVAAIAASTPVVVAMGNDQEDFPHSQFTVGPGATLSSNVDTSAASDSFVDTEYWYPGGDDYSIVVTLNGGVGGTVTANVGQERDRVVVGTPPNNAEVSIYRDTVSGDKQIFVEVELFGSAVMPNSITYALTRQTSLGSGRVDGYTQPAILGTNFLNFRASDGTITSPATAENVFAVASYNSKSTWIKSTGQSVSYSPSISVGALSSFSGQGPTRDNRQKPTLTAPGMGVASARSSASNPPANNILRDTTHVIDQGTSMAAPVVTGYLALKKQVSPNITVAELHANVASFTRQDSSVGTVPNSRWGYGKLMIELKPISAVAGLTAQALSASSARFTWTQHSEATSYNVFYATNTGVLAGAPTGTTFDLTGLPPNSATGIFIKPSNVAGDGPGAASGSVTTLASDPTGVAVIPHVTSMTVTFAPCAASACEGYRMEIAADSSFTTSVVSSVTANAAATRLQISGLTSLTPYFVRLGTLNSAGAVNYVGLGSNTTGNPIGAPGAGGMSPLSTSSMQVFWTANGNPAGSTYQVDLDDASDFSSVNATQQGAGLFTATFSSLLTNTSYYARVRILPSGAYLTLGPQSTLSAAPTLAATPYSNLATDGVRLAWGASNNPGGTVYLAQLSQASDFSGAVQSIWTDSQLFADFTGLAANTTYYGRVGSISRGGTASSFASAGALATLSQTPTALPLTAQTPTGFTGNWGDGGNSAGTLYLAIVSTMATLTPVAASSRTANTTATFTGLAPNTAYWFSVASLSHSGNTSPYLAAAATTTPAGLVSAATTLATNLTTTGLRANWSRNGNPVGTRFTAELADNPGFSGALSSTTANDWAQFTPAQSPNTPYYVRVKTLSNAAPNPDTGYQSLGSASTLAAAPAMVAQPYLHIGESSFTVRWTANATSPVTAAAEGYVLQASTSSIFGGNLFSTTLNDGTASRGVITGLAASTSYYVRIGALNWDGAANFASAGSSRTLARLLSSSTVSSSGLTLTAPTRQPEITALDLRVPPGAFPPGTSVSMTGSLQEALPAPVFRGVSATPLGDALGVELDAGGVQPLAPVSVTITFDPTKLPAGTSLSRVRIARYDAPTGTWVLQPSFASGNTVTAQVNHFSLFAPFLVQAAAGLDGVLIYPIPWKPGSTDANFNAAQLTMANLPAASSVEIFTITGERIWRGAADSAGVATWRGENQSGRAVGSGTYVILLESGGNRLAKRAVIVR